jgi:hypothetical protein
MKPTLRALTLSLALALGAASAALAEPLSVAANSYIRSIGMDPASTSVIAAGNEGEITGTSRGKPAVYSLEKLALARRPTPVRQFVETRTLIRVLKTNPALPFKPGPNYNADFLTAAEKALVARRTPAAPPAKR